ncbi:MAG: discoidin domain-containing protein [bacterium]
MNGNLGDFTHTFRDDQAATWAVDLEQAFWIDRVVLHNRQSCCQSRLRDVTVRVLDDAGAEVWASPLLNPENVLGGPARIEVAVGGVRGRTVQVERTPDLDFSGGQGNDDEPTVLSLGEVEVFGGPTASAPVWRPTSARRWPAARPASSRASPSSSTTPTPSAPSP